MPGPGSTPSTELARQVIQFAVAGLDRVKAAMDATRTALSGFDAATRTAANVVSRAVTAALSTSVNVAVGAKTAFVAVVQAAVTASVALAGTVGGALKNLFLVLGTIGAAIIAVTNQFSRTFANSAYQAIGTFLTAFGTIRAAVGQAFTGMSAAAQSFFNAVYQSLGPLKALVQQTMTALANSIKAQVITGVAGQLGQMLSSTFQRIQYYGGASATAIGLAVAAFDQLTRTTRQWVNAGMAGTNYGNLLNLHMTLFSQQVAGVFVPTMRALIDVLTRVTQWFRTLTGDQQTLIRRTVEAAAVMGLVYVALTRLQGIGAAVFGILVRSVAGLAATIAGTLIPAVGALTAAVVSGSGIMAASLSMATAGLSVLLGLAGVVISGLVTLGAAGVIAGAGVTAGSAAGREALAGMAAAFTPVLAALRRLGEAMEPLLESLGERFGNLAARALAGLAGWLLRLVPLMERFAPFLAQVGELIASAFERLPGIISAMVDVLTGALATVGAVLVAIFAPVVLAVGVLMAPLLAVGAVIQVLILSGVIAVGAAFRRVGEILRPLWDPIVRLFHSLWVSMIAIGQVVMALVSSLGGMWSRIFSEMGAGLQDLIILMAEWIRGLALDLPRIVNRMIRAIQDMAAAAAGAFNVTRGPLAAWAQQVRGMFLDIATRLANVRVDLGGTLSGQSPSRPEAPRTDVYPAGGNFEEAMALFRRINEVAVRTAAEQRREAWQDVVRDTLQAIAENTRPRPENRPVDGFGAPPGGGVNPGFGGGG